MSRLIALALLLAGCMSTKPEAWTHRPDEQTAAKAAIHDCESRTRAEMRDMAAFGGAVIPLAAIFSARGRFDDCMEAHGYRRD